MDGRHLDAHKHHVTDLMQGRPHTDPVISHLLIIGDSLSDRGTLYNSTSLFGFHLMRILAGISKTSPEGSFTNGLPWSDHFIASIANDLIIKQFERQTHQNTDDLADAIISKDKKVAAATHDFYDLSKDDKAVKYQGRNFARTYAEGGLTSHDYSWTPSCSLSRFVSRLILSTLEQKREAVFKDDAKLRFTKQDKAETLVLEWSGANDLITVNKRPSKSACDKSIAERVKNIEEMIKAGYRNFYIFNLPDLSLTPRYQNGSEAERKNAKKCSDYYNAELEKALNKLKLKYLIDPKSNIDIFDVNAEFNKMYQNPKAYHFEKDKLNKPFTKSKDFKILPNGTSPANGYAFWDDVHPSADLAYQLTQPLMKDVVKKYRFMPPKEANQSKRIKRIQSVKNLTREEMDRNRLFSKGAKEIKEKFVQDKKRIETQQKRMREARAPKSSCRIS